MMIAGCQLALEVETYDGYYSNLFFILENENI